MINKLKTLAIAMMTAGATVATTYAAALTNNGDVLQPVTVTLTVYGETPATFKTATLLTAVTNALTNKFSKKATLDLATEVSIVATTNIASLVTNFVTNTANLPVTLTLSPNTLPGAAVSNGVAIGGVSNIVIGNPLGDNVTIGTNITVVTVGDFGPVTNTYALTNVSITDNTVTVGTNPPVTVEDGTQTYAGSATNVDTNTITIAAFTNGVADPANSITNLLSTNGISVSSTTNGVTTVTIGGVSYTNGTGTNFEVLLGTNVVVSTNGAPGLGTSPTNTLTTLATTTISTVVSNNAGTNYYTNIVTTTITDLSTTNTTNISSITTNLLSITNTSSELVIADGGTNTTIPSAILSVSEVLDVSISKPVGNYAIEHLVLDTTTNALGTNGPAVASPWYIKLQGLVKNTTASVTISKTDKVAVTNEAWSDVSGYGTNGTTPIVLGGTISVASPSAEKQ
jgi:hypothetical protein